MDTLKEEDHSMEESKLYTKNSGVNSVIKVSRLDWIKRGELQSKIWSHK